MTSVVLTMPDDPEQLPSWLERRLLGPDLDLLIAELETLNKGSGATPVLEDVLAGSLPNLLSHGLSAVPRDVLKLLLRNPSLLLELRDLVLIQGGEFWDRIASDEGLREIGECVAEGVCRAIERETPTPVRRGFPGWLRYGAAIFGTAAAVLVALYLAGGLKPSGREVASARSPWGFARIQEIPKGTAEKEVFTRLADLAHEWSKQRPETAPDVARRLSEFREGCAMIQLESIPLSPRELVWLRLRCTDWAAEIDGHLRELEGGKDAIKVRNEVDASVATIEAELRARA